jgi:hypothetical protein
MLECGPESVVQCILGQLEIAEQPDKSRKDPPRLRTVKGINALPHAFDIVICHNYLISGHLTSQAEIKCSL